MLIGLNTEDDDSLLEYLEMLLCKSVSGKDVKDTTVHVDRMS